MARILFVSKDNGGSAMTIPLARVLEFNGHKVFSITEHLATKRFTDAGFKPYFGTTKDIATDPFYFDVYAALCDIVPDIIVVSAGWPIHLEQLFAVFANQMDIPLVCIEDYWAVSCKIKPACPNMVLSIDTYGEEIAKKLFHADMRVVFPQMELPVFSVGHHEVGAILDAQNDKKGIQIFVEKTQDFEFAVTLIGAGEQTASQIKLILKCMTKSTGRWCLVPRFHPKTLEWKGEDGRVFKDVWNELLQPFADRVVYVPEVKTETVVAAADIVASGFGTMMTGAAYIGKPTLCLKTPETMADLNWQSGGWLQEVPAVALQCADVVTEPTDLSHFIGKTYSRAQEEFQPYDPEKAYVAIAQLL